MKILLFRSNNLFASRVNKYVSFYKGQSIDFTAVGWDRKDEGLQKDGYDFFRYKAGTAIGGMKAVMNHFRWMVFVYKYIKAHPDATTIHACDLNSAFPAILYKKRRNRNLTVIFDACDWFSANFAGKRFMCKVFQQMEKVTCQWADELIICEPEREEQITFPLAKKPLVLYNIPEEDELQMGLSDDEYTFANEWPTLAYFGGFSENRFLTELFELAKTEKVNILVGGFGAQRIVELCDELNASLPNFRYFGKMAPRDGMQMSNSADVIYAMYCKTNPNNIYAAPNKFYEAMALGKPIISTKGTIVEGKIVKNNVGYAIEEDIEELRSLLRSLTREEMMEKGLNAKRLWEEKYKNCVSEFFKNEYSRIIK